MIIILFLSLQVKAIPLYGKGNGVTLTFRSGHALEDYEEHRESLYYRSTAEISSKNLIKIRAMRQHGAGNGGVFHSYGLYAKTPPGTLQLFGGDFSLSPGGGLILGRKIYMPSDPFNITVKHSLRGAIKLAGNSNPAYNFRGLALKASNCNKKITLSATAFLSKRKRFYLSQGEERTLNSSLNTILAKIYSEKKYITPIFINDRGLILSAETGGASMALFMFHTSMTNGENKTLRWDFNKKESPGGKENVRNGGAFLSYNSTSLKGYVELGLTSFKAGKWIYGKGVKGEVILKHGKTKLSLLGKNTDLNFNSPYSSGERGPMRAMELALSFPLHRFIRPGIKFSTVQDLKPESRDREYYRKTIEELHVRMGSSNGLRLRINFKKLMPQSEEPSYRMGAEIFSPKGGSLYGELKFMALQMEDIRSYGMGSHVSFMITESFSIKGGVSLILGKQSCPLYWTSKPAEKGAMPGNFYREKTGVFIVQASYKKQKNKVELRYQESRGKNSPERRLSFSGVIFFNL